LSAQFVDIAESDAPADALSVPFILFILYVHIAGFIAAKAPENGDKI